MKLLIPQTIEEYLQVLRTAPQPIATEVDGEFLRIVYRRIKADCENWRKIDWVHNYFLLRKFCKPWMIKMGKKFSFKLKRMGMKHQAYFDEKKGVIALRGALFFRADYFDTLFLLTHELCHAYVSALPERDALHALQREFIACYQGSLSGREGEALLFPEEYFACALQRQLLFPLVAELGEQGERFKRRFDYQLKLFENAKTCLL